MPHSADGGATQFSFPAAAAGGAAGNQEALVPMIWHQLPGGRMVSVPMHTDVSFPHSGLPCVTHLACFTHKSTSSCSMLLLQCSLLCTFLAVTAPKRDLTSLPLRMGG